MSRLAQAFAISMKDVESYYGKPPLVTWGLLFPTVLILAVYLKQPGAYMSVAPGIIGMTLLFGNTSMAAIVVTFEKRAGTLRRLLLAPVTERTIVTGKGASAAAYGLVTSLIVTCGLAALLGLRVARPVVFAAGLLLGAGTFACLGLIASVIVREVFEAMTLMNFFRFPLLFISGVFMPLDSSPAWLRPVAVISPLTPVVELLRFGISGRCAFGSAWVPFAALAGWFCVAWALAGPAFRKGARR